MVGFDRLPKIKVAVDLFVSQSRAKGSIGKANEHFTGVWIAAVCVGIVFGFEEDLLVGFRGPLRDVGCFDFDGFDNHRRS